MRIVVFSRAFAPSLGGLEEVARICCEQFADFGHEVEVVTESESDEDLGFQYPVHRTISGRQKLKLCKQADVVLMFNISLRDMVYPIMSRRPLIISHQGGYLNSDDPFSVTRRLKMMAARLATGHITCSDAVGTWIRTKAVTIPNTFDDTVFRLRPELQRSKDVLFVGRLVSDKGADLLLDALADSRVSSLAPSVTIVGDGPELSALKQQANRLHLNAEFPGRLGGEALGRMMNQHRILVVPSRWEEPFGIVALEGIASGCQLIVSDGGGLPEAVGPCGLTFPNNDLNALIEALNRQLRVSPELKEGCVEQHLSRHSKTYVCQRYHEELMSYVARGANGTRNAA